MEAVAKSHTTSDPSPLRKPCPEGRTAADFDALYREHAQPLYYFILRLLGDPAQSEEAAHDVFLKAWRNFSEFRGESQVRTWLYRIAINHCRNLMASWHHRHIISGVDETLWDTTPSPGDGPLRVLETKELGARIQKTMDRLSEEYRMLLLLIADQQLSYDEVGALTGQSTDAIRGKLYRARRAFALEFEKLA